MTKITCYHANKRVVWTSVDKDCEPLVMRQLRHQCEDCGRLLPNALPHSTADHKTPEVDIQALRRWIKNDREQWDRSQTERWDLERQRQREWRARYEQYLMSDQWMLKREKVFQRCGGICEGCRENKATAVHHLTYDHLGDELLWELAAVCRECHERAHNIGSSSQSRDHYQLGTDRPVLRNVSQVLFEAQKSSSETEMPRRNDQSGGSDVGLQSLRMDRRRT